MSNNEQKIMSTEISPPDKPPLWVDTPEALASLLSHLRGNATIAVDTESDSFYSYYEKVCLIQFSIPGEDYLVDPLAPLDLSSLGEIFADPQIQKVFHAAENDLLGLKRDFNFRFANIFDTMIAARILGWRRYSLASILKERFGVTLDKRMQRYNWGQRPLSQRAMEYARLDTFYLLRLRALQERMLQNRGRWREARGAFERVIKVQPTPKHFNPDDFWRIRGAHDLRPEEQAILRELYIYRDNRARSRDLPPFKVLPNATLVRLAVARPNGHEALARVHGMTPYLLRREARGILAAIAQGLRRPAPASPHNNQKRRPDEATTRRYEELRRWRKDIAERRGVEPDVILPNNVLMALARRAPQTVAALKKIKIMGEWQRQTYGAQVLAVLKRLKEP
jgi:ribonuclease D